MIASMYISARHARAVFRIEVEQFPRPLEREHEVAADDLALHRVQRELEARDDAEVAAAAAHAPEQVRVLVRRRALEAPVGSDDVDGAQVVHREPVTPREPAEPAAEGQPADARMRHRARRSHESERHRFVVDLAEQAPALDVHGARFRVDSNAANPGQVELQPAVAGGLAAVAVASALDREQQLALAREIHGAAHVRGAARLDDERRPAVDRAVEHAPRFLVTGIPGDQQRAAQLRLQRGEVGLRDDGRGAVELDGGKAARGLARGLVEREEPRRRQRVCDRGGERGLEEPASVDHATSPAATVLPRNAERRSKNAA